MSAAYRLQAARHYPTGVPDEILVTTQYDVEAFNREIRAEGVRSFIEAASECRMALAAVTPFCPGVKPYWDAFELPEQADEVISVLREYLGSAKR